MAANIPDLQHVFNLNVILNENNSYLRSYQAILQQTTDKENLTFEDIIGLAHMIYGWMPTVLKLRFENVSQEEIVRIVNAARHRRLDSKEIDLLKIFVNNSLVGTSKLLHFVAPQTYAIWDSKIYFFLFQKQSNHKTIGNIKTYFEYLSKLDDLEKHPKFMTFHEAVNQKLTYSVSAKRALEVMMFEHSKLKNKRF
ncbi:MAG: hypothetical protein WBO07_03875 [Formosimonas sp.]|jgi:hypothetical protein